MGFITDKRSSQMTKILPKIKSRSRKSYPNSQLKDVSRDQCKVEVLDLVPKKKSGIVSEIEDIDLEHQLKLAEEMTKGNDSMWLSSDCNSLSLLVSDRSGEIWELSSSNLSPNDKLHGVLSSYGSSQISVSDGTGINHVDVNCEFLKEGCSLKNPSVCCFDSGASSYDPSLMEESSVYGSSCTSLSTLDDSALSISESDKTSMWISKLNINLEGSQLVHQKEDEVGFSHSDFSSPSHSFKGNSQSEFSFSSSNSATSSHLTEASRSSSREFEYDEPLFWPYHENSYKISESDKSCLCISPRKAGRMVKSKEINAFKSAETKLRKPNSMPASRKIMQRPESSQTPKKSVYACKTKVLSNKSTQKSPPSPLQLSRTSPQVSSRLAQCTISTKARNSFTKKELKNQTQKKEKVPKKHLLEFEASHFLESLLKGVAIEKIIGLDEFDGHEGLSADFCEDFHLIL